jgi:hypothetical protein
MAWEFKRAEEITGCGAGSAGFLIMYRQFITVSLSQFDHAINAP